jgi:hypothetical protein
MRMVIVPNDLRDAINAKIDAEIANLPEDQRQKAENCREHMYHQLLSYFDDHGAIPDCHIVANDRLHGREGSAAE